MKKFSEISPENIKNISHSNMVKKDGIKLKTLKVEFIGIENQTYKLLSAEYVTESSHSFEYSERIGYRFSGNGSSDGMRDAFETVKRTFVDTNLDPCMMNFVYMVKKNGKIITDYPTSFNMKDYE